jgi:hypothetical protein
MKKLSVWIRPTAFMLITSVVCTIGAIVVAYRAPSAGLYAGWVIGNAVFVVVFTITSLIALPFYDPKQGS